MINGVVGFLFLGGVVVIFFIGLDFYINKGNMVNEVMFVISYWGNGWYGLDVLINIWNVILGLVVFFLVCVLGVFYFINNIVDKELVVKCCCLLIVNMVLFLVFFLVFVICILLVDGYVVNLEIKEIYMEFYKYFNNFIEMLVVFIVFFVGVVLVLFGIGKILLKKMFDKGIWFVGIGMVLIVLVLLLIVGYNNMVYYLLNMDI